MDRFFHAINERLTAEDLTRPELIRSRAVLHSLLGPLTGGTLAGYLAADLGQGILFGLNVTTPGAVKTVDVSPGEWLGHDASIVNPYDNPRTHGRREVAETGIAIADAAGGLERLDLISVPTTRSLLESNADTESRDIKNPTTGVLGPQTVAKRISTILAAATVTAGTEVAGGTLDLTDDDTHDKWTGVDGIDDYMNATAGAGNNLGGLSLPAGHIPVAIVFKDDAANIVTSDIHDARQMTSLRTPSTVHIHRSAVLPQSVKDIVANLGVAKAGAILQGTGAAAMTSTAFFNINENNITNPAVGVHQVRFNRDFAATSYLVQTQIESAGAGQDGWTVSVVIVSVNTFQLRIFDGPGAALADLPAGASLHFSCYGQQ